MTLRDIQRVLAAAYGEWAISVLRADMTRGAALRTTAIVIRATHLHHRGVWSSAPIARPQDSATLAEVVQAVSEGLSGVEPKVLLPKCR